MNRIDGMPGTCTETCDIAKGSEHWDKFTGACTVFGREGDDPVKCYMGWNNESTYIIAGALQDKESLGSRFIEFVYSLPAKVNLLTFETVADEEWISYENFIDFMRDEYEDFDNLEAMGTPKKYLGLSCIQQSPEGLKESERENTYHPDDCTCAHDEDHGNIGWNDPILNTDELDTLLLSMYLNTDFSSNDFIALEPAKKIKQTSGKPELRRGKR